MRKHYKPILFQDRTKLVVSMNKNGLMELDKPDNCTMFFADVDHFAGVIIPFPVFDLDSWFFTFEDRTKPVLRLNSVASQETHYLTFEEV